MGGVDRALSFKNSEVRSAILKIFQWLDDPKNAILRDVIFLFNIFLIFPVKSTLILRMESISQS